MNSFTYRNAVVADQPQLKNLGLISYGQFKEVLLEENWTRLEAVLSAEGLYEGLLKTSTGFVCESDNLIVGMAFLIPSGNPTEIFQADWSYIRMVGVDPKYSGQGIGKRLMQMCIDQAKKTQEKVIALHTSEFMNAARHVYENFGFRQFKELPQRYGKRYWIYKLEFGE